MTGTKILKTPVKASKDSKDYRSLELSNGLRVLLISDVSYPLDKLDEEEKCLEELEENEEEMEDETSSDDEEEYSDVEEEYSDVEEKTSQHGNKETSKSLSGLKKSAAGLCIGVGSFSDPESLPGLAHFLEHMVFMGSNKYPDENSFDHFIQSHGGFDNASTDTETTTFYFETQRKSFSEALDRFAQFFISPLLKMEAMQREREAVDSEFIMGRQSDSNRKQQIFGSLSKDKHPMSKFMWGNIRSLSTNSDDWIHQRLLDFKNKYYGSQSMTLVVQAQQTLETLQTWVEASFTSVPKTEFPSPSFSHLTTSPFEISKFNQIIKIIPIQNENTLELNWSLPPLISKYKSKPLHILSWIIGHEGPGSLISLLRQKTLALNITAGNGGDGFEFNSTYSLFTISLQLTKEGLNSVNEILTLIFSFLRTLVREGPNERIYEEIKRIEELNFEFGDDVSAIENVEKLCENMQWFPSEDILTGDDLLITYDPNLIMEILSVLVDVNKVNIFLSSKEFDSEKWTKMEPWFETLYESSQISSESKRQWSEGKENVEAFSLPAPNIFIAENTELIAPSSNSESRYPTRLCCLPTGELFYKKDELFKKPIAYLYFYFSSTLGMESISAAVSLDLFVNCAVQYCTEETYAADLAQLHYSLTSDERGLSLKINGLNDKIKILLETLLRKLNDFSISQRLFDAVKEQTKRNYYNTFIRPSKLVRDLRISLLQNTHYTNEMRFDIIDSITLADMEKYLKDFRSSAFLQGLIQGNVSSEEAQRLFEMVHTSFLLFPKSTMTSCSLSSRQIPTLRCHELSLGVKFLRTRSRNTNDSNTLITNYYQVGPGDLKTSILLQILCLMLEEPVFDVLRTQETLGYQVFSMLRNTHGVLGFSITVNSQETKFSVDHVNERIEAFLQSSVLDKQGKDFLQIRNTLVKMKKAADMTLEEEVLRNWSEILSTEYIFDRHEREIEMIEKVESFTQIKDFFFSFLSKESLRKLSVQIIGAGGQNSETLKTLENKGYYSDGSDVFICDLESYKKTLKCHPFIPIVP